MKNEQESFLCRLCGQRTPFRNATYIVYVDGYICPKCLTKCNEDSIEQPQKQKNK